VPRKLVDDAHAHAIFRLRTAVEVLHEQRFLFAERGEEISLERGEVLGAHLLVAAIEPDVALRRRILDRELVLRGTARVLAGLHDERAVLGKETFLARHSLFDERGPGSSEAPPRW